MSTIRRETERMMGSCDWEGATADHVAALYAIMHERVYRCGAEDKGVRRRATEHTAEFFDGGIVDAVNYQRWAWAKAKKDAEAGKEKRLSAAILFSGAMLTEYRVHLARRGELRAEEDEREREEDRPAWFASLAKTRTGEIKRTVANVITILSRDERWKDVIAYDAFAETITTTQAPPWHEDDAPKKIAAGDWTDEDTTRLSSWLSREHKVDVGPAMALDAVNVISRRREIHPVRDWLRSLVWDGSERLDAWLVDYCGADDTDYVHAVGAMVLISAVARVEVPGCKVDTMMVLTGRQGIGKSRLIRTLAGDEWTCETQIDIGTKDAMQVLRRKWMVELSELESLTRSEAARAKAFVSTQIDTYRASYGRGARDYPRQCIFIGTTNAEAYLRDETGGRRYWPVQVRRIDVAEIARDRAQLWAEAHARYAKGERWYITDPTILRAAQAEQDARYQVDPWEPPIAEWLRDADQPRRRTRGVTTTAIMRGALKIDTSKMSRADEMRVGAILGRLGWERRRRRDDEGGRSYVYTPAAARALRADDGDSGDEEGTGSTRKARGHRRSSLLSLPSSRVCRGGDQDRSNTRSASTDQEGTVGT